MAIQGNKLHAPHLRYATQRKKIGHQWKNLSRKGNPVNPKGNMSFINSSLIEPITGDKAKEIQEAWKFRDNHKYDAVYEFIEKQKKAQINDLWEKHTTGTTEKEISQYLLNGPKVKNPDVPVRNTRLANNVGTRIVAEAQTDIFNLKKLLEVHPELRGNQELLAKLRSLEGQHVNSANFKQLLSNALNTGNVVNGIGNSGDDVLKNIVGGAAGATGGGAGGVIVSGGNPVKTSGLPTVVNTGVGAPGNNWEWAQIIEEIPNNEGGTTQATKGFFGKAWDFLKRNKKTAIIATAIAAVVAGGVYLYNRNKTSDKANPTPTSSPVQDLANKPVGGVITANGPYGVVKGDNVWNIAKAHLQELNKDTKDYAASDVEIYHHVQKIMELNDLHYEKDNYRVIIKPGQVLKLQ